MLISLVSPDDDAWLTASTTTVPSLFTRVYFVCFSTVSKVKGFQPSGYAPPALAPENFPTARTAPDSAAMVPGIDRCPRSAPNPSKTTPRFSSFAFIGGPCPTRGRFPESIDSYV